MLAWCGCARILLASSYRYNKGGTVKVGGNPVNLHELYNEVREHGGQRQVTEQKAWKKVAAALSLSPCNAEMCRSLRNTYQRYLGPISGVSPPRERPGEQHQQQLGEPSLVGMAAAIVPALPGAGMAAGGLPVV